MKPKIDPFVYKEATNGRDQNGRPNDRQTQASQEENPIDPEKPNGTGFSCLWGPLLG